MNSYMEIMDIIKRIPNNQSIIIAGHENADMDSIGSSLAIAYILEKIGKKDITVLLSDKDMYKIKWFESNKFLKNGVNKENYVFIMLDLNRKERLKEFEKYFDEAEMTINIDHHEKNRNESDFVIYDTEISSTCEMIYNLCECLKCNLDKNIATMLYAGILTDTASFSIRITPNTLRVASKLLEYGIDYEYITKKTYLERSKAELDALSQMINNMKFNIFHYIIVNKKDAVFKDLEYSQIFKKMFPILRNIEGIEVLGVFLLDGEYVYGEYKSNSDIDISELAIKLGGGGHKKSAGFTSKLKINDILDISRQYIGKALKK